jgi:hypothetical protein
VPRSSWFVHGCPTVRLLDTFGLVSRFLLAGPEVEFGEFRRGLTMITVHLLERDVMYAATAWRPHDLP